MAQDIHNLFVAHFITPESPGLEDGGVTEVILAGEVFDCIVTI